jgi:CRISPR-associated protein Cmr4
MFKNANPLFLICETQLHAGSGDDLGIVDLPIQRERHTSFPKIEASSFKGAVREALEGKLVIKETDDTKAKENLVKINKIFGFDDGELAIKQRFSATKHLKENFGEDTQFAGCIAFTDARLLLFPVKSMKGVFAWITCPRVLRQWEKDMKLTERNESFSILYIPKNISDGDVYLTNKDSSTKIGTSSVILEEYAFTIKTEKDAYPKIGEKSLGDWLSENLFAGENLPYWEEKIKKDILILSDNDFKDFVNLSTEVITRTKINNETGTVQDGALFTEEFLPSESILYTLVLTAAEFKKSGDGLTEQQVKDCFIEAIEAESVIQVGGNATLGKGIIRTKFLTPKEKGDENE